MLNTYSIFMMLLAITASLVGISSSIYKPANVETQPQVQSQRPLITQEQNKRLTEIMADAQLLDRLFPQIIKRMDGKTLATKVLPYLDLNVALIQRTGQIGSINVGTLSPGGAAWGKAGCAPGETAVSAGFTHQIKGGSDLSVFSLWRQDPNSNAWDITTSFDDTGKVFTYAECLKVESALKDVRQPQQPSQPTGGPPLRPPPEFGK